MVVRASEQGRVGREINRALDDKYAALLRKVGSEEDEGLAALWNDLCGRGLVAAAYWAIMSHAHVAEELKVHAFGEVHMLSHFMGGYNRHSAKELWTAERQIQELEAGSPGPDARARRRSPGATGGSTNSSRSWPARAMSWPSLRASRAARQAAPSGAGRRGERRLAAARARGHALEAENQRLQALLSVFADATPLRAAPAQASSAVAEPEAAPLEGRCCPRRWRAVPAAAASARPRRGVQRLPAAP